MFLAIACGRSTGGVALVDRLPASAAGVIVMNRSGSEAQLREVMKTLPPLPFAHQLPACALDLVAKVDQLALSFGDDPKLVFVGHGAGLRAAFESCLKVIAPRIEVKDEGDVTGYHGPDLTFYLAWIDGDTVVGGADEPRSAAALRSLPPLSGNASLSELRKKVDVGAPVWFAIDPTASKELGSKSAQLGVKRAWAELGLDWMVKATLETESAEKATELAANARTGVARTLAEAGLDVSAKVTTDGALVVITADLGAPVRKLMGASELPPAAVSFAAIGFAAGLALPFTQNKRKAKTAEATVLVKKLHGGALAYYAEHHGFPPSVGPTPPLGSCCGQPKNRCAPDAKLWEDPSWKALGFALEDPHYYSYRFTSDGDQFSVGAYGDLNCDGVYSTFEMSGKFMSDGTIGGAGGIYQDRPLE